MIIPLIILLIGIVYFYLTRNFDYWSKRGVEFPKPTLLFGNLKDVCLWRTTIGEHLRSVYQNSKEPFVGLFLLDEPCLVIRDLDIIRNVLIKDFDHFRDRTMANNEKHDGIGSNILFLMKSPKWTEIRRKMSPAFSSAKMKLMSKLIIESAENMVEYLREKISRNESVEVRDLITRFTIDSITSTAFGLQGECFKNKEAPFRVIAGRIYNWRLIWHSIQIFCFFFAQKFVHLFHMRFVDETASNFFRDVFWKTLKERERTKTVRNDFLDILMEMKKADDVNDADKIDGDVLVAQATQFFIAGFETTSSTLSFLILELVRNPEIQKKVREDIINARNKFGCFSYESLQEMEYLESTIYETVRKYPILPFLDRRCNKTYKIPGTDLVLEEGDKIFIPIMGIQYDPLYYPDPDRFEPERFYKENRDQRQNINFLGFGEGPRYCIGRRYGLLNAKACLAHLLSRFEVKSNENIDKKFKFNKRGTALQPEEDIFLTFQEIQ